MRYFIVLVMSFMVAGCSTIPKFVSYAQSNPAIVNLVTQQSVAKYIEASESIHARAERAARVQKVIANVESFLSGNPSARADTIMAVLLSSVDIEKLDVSDRLLVDAILTSVEVDLSKHSASGILDPEAVIRIRVLLRVLDRTAGMYL